MLFAIAVGAARPATFTAMTALSRVNIKVDDTIAFNIMDIENE